MSVALLACSDHDADEEMMAKLDDEETAYVVVSVRPIPSIALILSRSTLVLSIMSGFLVFILAIVSLGAGLVGWFATPKGMNQTSVDLGAYPSLSCSLSRFRS